MLSSTPTPGEVVFAFSPGTDSPFEPRDQPLLASGLASGTDFAASTSADPTTGAIDITAQTGSGRGLAIAGNGFSSSFVPEVSGRYHVEWEFSSQLRQHFRNSFALQPAAQLLARLGDDFVGPDTLLGVNLVAYGFGLESIQEMLQGNSSLAHAGVKLSTEIRGPNGTLFEDTPISSHLQWWNTTSATDYVSPDERFVSTSVAMQEGAAYHWQFDVNTEVVLGGWRGRLEAGADNAYRLDGDLQLNRVRVIYDGPIATTLVPDLVNSELTLSPGEARVIAVRVEDTRNNTIRRADVRYELLSRSELPGGSGEWVFESVLSGRFQETSEGYLASITAPPIGGSYHLAITASKPGAHTGRMFEELVVIPHVDPTLSDPRVDPYWTSGPQERVFSVQYSDPDGDPPVLARAYVDGTVHELELVRGTPFSSTYELRTADLAVGRHEYSLAFIDASGGIAITNTFNGPVIGEPETAFRFSAIVHGGPSSNDYHIDVSQLGVIEGSELVPPGVTHWLSPNEMVTISAREVRGPGQLSGSHRFVVWEAFDKEGHMAGGFPKSFPTFTMTPDLGAFEVIGQWSYEPYLYTVAGSALDCNNRDRPQALGGVALRLDGFHQGIARSDGNGAWEFQEVPGGTSYTITPELAGHVFTPPQVSFENLVQHHSDLTFCARRLDPFAPTTEFVRVPPNIQTESSRVTFEWAGRDNLSAPETLQYQYRVDNGQPSTWSSSTRLSTELANGAHTLSVRARDEDGNVAASWTSHEFAVSAAPRVSVSTLLDQGIHRAALSVTTPPDTTTAGDQVVFTADQFGLVGESYVPVKLFRKGEVTPSGAFDSVAHRLALPGVFHATDVGFVFSLPEVPAAGATVEYEIQFGQLVRMGWQEEVSVPESAVNMEIHHGQHLDQFGRLWRLGSNQVKNSDADVDDDSYLFVQAGHEHGSVVDETLVDIHFADFRVVEDKFYGTRWLHLPFERPFIETPTEIWAFWRIEERTDSEEDQGVSKHAFAFQRFNKITRQPIGAPIASPLLGDGLYSAPVPGVSGDVWLVGTSAAEDQLFYARINANAEIVEHNVVVATHPPDLVAPRFVDVRNPVFADGGNVWLFYGRGWDTSSTSSDRREQVFFKVLNPDGTVFKGETPLSPPPPTEEQNNRWSFLSGPLIDNSGQVWISFVTEGVSGIENYYSILTFDGSFFKNAVLTTAARHFRHVDHDGNVWAVEQNQSFFVGPDDTVTKPTFTATERIPNQSLLASPVSVLVDWDRYQKFDRWDHPTRTLLVSSAPGSARLEVLDLDEFGQAAHVTNLTVRLNQSTIAEIADEAPAVSEFDVSFSDQTSLLDFQQTGLMGGEIIASFIDNVRPFVASFTRRTPLSPWTNTNELVFRASFSEDVARVDPTDFRVNGSSTASVAEVTPGVRPDTFDVTLSGGDLADFNGLIGLDLAGSHDITDLVGNPLRTREPRLDQRYLVDNLAPQLISFTRQDPLQSPTNMDRLVFRAAFDEVVTNVDPTDFAVQGTTTATVTAVANATRGDEYDVTISGGDLLDFRGVVGLDLAGGQDITDRASNPLPVSEPAVDETYTLSDLDFGDAPTADQSGFANSYPTTLRDNGAGHAVSPLFLGQSVDSEPDGQPHTDAGVNGVGGDDHHGQADEDGVLFVTSIVGTDSAPTVATIAIVASQAGVLDAWIDFGREGDWDESAEHIVDSLAVSAGLNVVPFAVPVAQSTGETAARFRLSSAGGLMPTGPAADGEVEDYFVDFIDGAGETGADAAIQLPLAAALDFLIDGTDVVAQSGGLEWFRAPRNSLNRLDVVGSSGDDHFNLADTGIGFGELFAVQGADGHDTLQLSGAGSVLDLTQLGDSEIHQIETIDLHGTVNTLVLNRDEVWNINEAHELYVLLEADDTIDFQSGWQFEPAEKTRVERNEFFAVLQQDDARLLLSGPFDWHNPIRPLDTDTNEVISPRDALVIINELNNGRFHSAGGRLVDAATAGPFDFTDTFFFDVRPDNHISPVDALRIIDFLNGASATEPAEGESPPLLSMAAESFAVRQTFSSVLASPNGNQTRERSSDANGASAADRLSWYYTPHHPRAWSDRESFCLDAQPRSLPDLSEPSLLNWDRLLRGFSLRWHDCGEEIE